MNQPNFKEQSIAVFGQEFWDKNQAEVEGQIALERAADEARVLEPLVYDLFPERGGPVLNVRGERITLQDGTSLASIRVVGEHELMRVCRALEPTNGPLMVKHVGRGYLDRFSKGELKVGTYADEAVAQAVAEVTSL